MKKIILLLALLLPLGVFAQEIKIAVVDASAIFNLMPELDAAEKEMAAVEEKYTTEHKTMQDEFNLKYEDYMKVEATLTDNLKTRRQTELQDLQARIQNFLQLAQEDIPREQQRIYAPIQEKITTAIKAVGDEQGYTLIVSPQYMLYVGKTTIDATPFVKAKLGIK
ncbi:MAG: OmpH family outer membrane protein [Tannerella sp.]|jgi:outer membrane protein|nr:OmpH family outer membrane protein [Tannerella sp.]